MTHRSLQPVLSTIHRARGAHPADHIRTLLVHRGENSSTTGLIIFHGASNYYCNRRSIVQISRCTPLAIQNYPSTTKENTL